MCRCQYTAGSTGEGGVGVDTQLEVQVRGVLVSINTQQGVQARGGGGPYTTEMEGGAAMGGGMEEAV